MSELVKSNNDVTVINDSVRFQIFLDDLGLPSDNVIANTNNRQTIFNNLPVFIQSLPDGVKKDARYLSKFVAATSIGLFDAALNYVWNEVILNLRKKVILYGLDLFYDSAVGGKNREFYNTEDDLSGIKDVVLVDSCRKLELISDVVYRKISYILVMRNEVAASHPNVDAIGAYELMGWLETCVKDVLKDEQSPSSIKIKSLVDNLKSASIIFDESTLNGFKENIKFLSQIHTNNLLITLFGIFTSATSATLIKNISLIAPTVWELSSEKTRIYIGELLDSYRSNLNQQKLDSAINFLKVVGGLRYERLETRIIILAELTRKLNSARDGWDNFYNEPPVAMEILGYCKQSDDIPGEVASELIKAVLRCRIGKGCSYSDGVSSNGVPLYDKFLSILNEQQVITAIIGLFDFRIMALMGNKVCIKHAYNVLLALKNQAVSDRVIGIIDYMLTNINSLHALPSSGEFKDLCKPHIQWK